MIIKKQKLLRGLGSGPGLVPDLIKTCLFLGLVLFLFLLRQDQVLLVLKPSIVTVSPSQAMVKSGTQIAFSTPIDGEIRYTTDGSLPDESSALAEGKVEVSEPTLFRFAVFDGNHQVSKVQNHEVFVDAVHAMPIVSLITEPENLWDDEIGIYTEGNHNNYLQTGEDWERQAEFRMFDKDGKKIVEQKSAIRLHGNAMRKHAQKGFRIYAVDDEGRKTTLQYPLFGEDGNSEYASFILRPGGDPTTLLRDRLAPHLIPEDSSIVAQKSRPVVLYLNGKYWGLYYLYERFDETFFSEKFRLKKSTLVMIDIPLATENNGFAVADTDNADKEAELYNELLASTAQCDHCGTYQHINQYIDMPSLVDYFVIELFSANVDWPYNNAKYWRYDAEEDYQESVTVPELDGRLRPVLFDLDAAFGAGYSDFDQIASAASSNTYSKLVDNNFPFRNLFRGQIDRIFQRRTREMIETTLASQHLTSVVDDLASEIRPEISSHIERWYPESTSSGIYVLENPEDWEQQIINLKEYLKLRPEAFARRTQQFFESDDN